MSETAILASAQEANALHDRILAEARQFVAQQNKLATEAGNP